MVAAPARGEVWWGESPDHKGRPYLVVTRDEAIPVLRTVLVPVIRTVRDIPSEVALGPCQGVPTECWQTTCQQSARTRSRRPGRIV